MSTERTEGQALMDFQFVMPDRTNISLGDDMVVFRRGQITENVNEGTKAAHQFTAITTDLTERVMPTIMRNANPTVRWRLGVGTGPKDRLWLPWQTHHVVNYHGFLEGIGPQTGYVVEINTIDFLYRANRASKIAAHTGFIHDIVRKLAEQNGFEDTVIEETSVEGSWIQSLQSDIEFIRERLLSRAVNKQGQAGYFFFIRDGALHFHTPGYQSEIKEVDYFSVQHNRLGIVDGGQQLWDAGIAGVRMVVHNPLTGASGEIIHKPENAYRLSDRMYQFENVDGAQLNVPYHSGQNPDAPGIAQAIYQKARLRCFQVNLGVEKIVTVRAGDFVRLLVTPTGGRESRFSGLYFVSSVAHQLAGSQIKSMYTLVRGEISKDTVDYSTLSPATQQLVPETEASGQPVNIGEVLSSQRTKGAGKQASDRLFTSVSDAAKGPFV